MTGLTYPPQRDFKRAGEAGREGAAAHPKSVFLPTPCEPPQGTIPVLLLEKHLGA